MVSSTPWRDDGREEQLHLDRYLRFLEQQGYLDELDIDGLRGLADEKRTLFELEGWQQIADQLIEQGEDDLAERVAPATDNSLTEAVESLRANSSSNTEWAVFIGAGGSKPEPTSLPLVSDLLPTLWQKATEINAKHLLDLQQRCDSLGIENIEELLTAVDLTRSAAETPRVRLLVQDLLTGRSGEARARDGQAIARPGMLRRPSRDEGLQDSGLADRLQESMQTLFSLLVGMMRMAQPNDFHKALAKRAKGDAPLTIVTTNYDVCVERALKGAYAYGGIEELNSEATAVLKLHGSLNWFACSSCDEVVAARLTDIESLTKARLFPVVSQCPECDATAPHLIVPPVGNKLAEHPVLLQVRQQSEEAMKSAGVVVFVGYSFNEADEYVLRMVSRAVAGSNRKIIVFDVDRGSVGRLGAFLTAHARGYSVPENVMFIRGDAAVTFPDFVDATSERLVQIGSPAVDGVVD